MLLDGFSDADSGLVKYEILFSYNIGTTNQTTKLTVIPSTESSFDSDVIPLLHNGSAIVASVFAVNRVGLTGEPANATRPVILSHLHLEDPIILGPGFTPLAPLLMVVASDAISVGFNGASDPMAIATRFSYSWSILEEPCEDGEEAGVAHVAYHARIDDGVTSDGAFQPSLVCADACSNGSLVRDGACQAYLLW